MRVYKVLAMALLAGVVSLPAFAGGAQVLDYTMKDIDGNEVDLAKYKGGVVMIVNVASKCGLTPQYEQLQDLHEKYSAKGLKILGFPANNFMGQEPGTNEERKAFCVKEYDVKFDMFSKISVKDEGQADLYKELTSETENEGFGGDITWNFEKFLVNREGNVIARFAPQTKPNAPKVIAAIEKELAKKS